MSPHESTMRRRRVALCAVLGVLGVTAGGLAGCKQKEPIPTKPDVPASAVSAPDAGTPGVKIVLDPTIPPDATFGPNASTLAQLQHDFDTYSWNTFIAANWPVGADGGVDPTQPPGKNGDNPTVWQGWMPATSIFLAGGATPPAWGAPPVLPAICQGKLPAGGRFLTQVGKTPGLLNESVQPFDTGPLLDQQGNYARFEILVNQVMFNQIVSQQLYSKAGQQQFNAPANFTCGSTKTGEQGAIMVKAAWKPLEDPADVARFHSTQALVYTPASVNPKIQETCTVQLMGLVGLHIGHKTSSAAQWIWSTFEHVDNVPTQEQVKAGKLAARYNFFNPACTDCVANQTPPRPWDPNKKIVVNGKVFASQIVRVDVRPPLMVDSARLLNAEAKALLGGVNPKSVWTNYELISTQWPTNPGSCAVAELEDGSPAPQFLANSTLETYIQGKVPGVSSSCIRCHNNAAMTTGKSSDFTFLLERAQ